MKCGAWVVCSDRWRFGIVLTMVSSSVTSVHLCRCVIWERSDVPPVGEWSGQRNDSCSEAWSLCWMALSLDCRLDFRCSSAQVSHLVLFGMGGAPQSTHSARDLAAWRLAAV